VGEGLATVKPHIKKSPFYVNPNKIHVNPLFTEGIQLNPVKSEINYYWKMVRSLSCLKNSLGNQTKEREIKVKFPDKSVKSFVVDEGKSVDDLTHEIASKVGIKNTEEFSLQREENDVWLNPYQTLQAQGVLENRVLMFRKKFYYNDAFTIDNDPVYFNLLFCQSHEAIVSGLYPCSLHEAVPLAATQFQINFGDHNPSIHKPGFLSLKELKFFLPTDCLENWGITFQKLEKMIYKEHQKLRGIKEEYAKYRYLQLCRTLSTYGTVFFSSKICPAKGKGQSQAAIRYDISWYLKRFDIISHF